MRQRKIKAIVPFVLLVGVGHVFAAVESFQFQGQVNFVSPASVSGPVMTVGMPVSGSFSYDSATPATYVSYASNTNIYVQDDQYILSAPARFDLTIGSNHWHSDSLHVNVIQFAANQSPQVIVSSGSLQEVGGGQAGSVQLTLDPTNGNANALSKFALPVQFAGTTAGGSNTFESVSGSPTFWMSSFTITNITSLPEASVWAMNLLGLGLISMVYRRSRSGQ